jgi:hypothetical protein
MTVAGLTRRTQPARVLFEVFDLRHAHHPARRFEDELLKGNFQILVIRTSVEHVGNSRMDYEEKSDAGKSRPDSRSFHCNVAIAKRSP